MNTEVICPRTLSSSDGQRFPTRGKSVTARALSRYFANEGLSTYTHVTDQHATYGTKVIVATRREAHYVLDEILGNATDLPITEHATDTHGVTLVNFGLFDLLGLQLSPRIRDLGRITLYRAAPRAQVESAFPHAGPLLTRKLNLDLIAEHYDDLLRLSGSLKFGHATASLLVGKLSASGRQNALAAALKEYGALRRTIYAARYLSDPGYRRKISRQLNKGESLHALRRDLLYAHEGDAAYLADPYAIFIRPLLDNLDEPRTAAFIDAFAEMNQIRPEQCPDTLERVQSFAVAAQKAHTAWRKADGYARAIGMGVTSTEDHRTVRRIRSALGIALDDSATGQERETALRTVQELAAGIVTIPDRIYDSAKIAIETTTRKQLTS